MERRERDSNPRYLSAHTLSRRAPSATRASPHHGPTIRRNRCVALVARSVTASEAAPSLAPGGALRLRRLVGPFCFRIPGTGGRIAALAASGCRRVSDTDARLAEREGFEPPVELPPHLISNQAHSTRLCHLSRGTCESVTSGSGVIR